MRAISTVSTPQRAALRPELPVRTAACSRRGGAQQAGGVGAAEAAREHQRDVAARRARVARDGSAAQAGSSAPSVAMPGTVRGAQRRERQHRLDQARGRQQVAEGPLEAGDRRHVGAEHAAPARAPRRRRTWRVPLPCATIMPTSRRLAARRRASAASIARTSPSPSSRTGSRPSPSLPQPEPEQFAEHAWRRARCAARFRLQHQRRGAFAHHAAVVARVERPQRLRATAGPVWW